MRLVFTGHIAGAGSGSGLRIVVGAWDESPFGAFTDVMLQTADDERVLLAPDDTIADFVSSTYHFDRVELGEVSTALGEQQFTVTTESFDARIGIGGPAPIDRLLRLVPRLALLRPPVSFGFSSAPSSPQIVSMTTTIDESGQAIR